MKKVNPIAFIVLFMFVMLSSLELKAQSKITERFLLGTWQLKIDIEDELEQETEEADSMFESIILSAVTNAVTGILDRIDITIDFRSDGEAKLIVNAFGNQEIEYTEWFIDKKGRLSITETDNFKTDLSEYWARDGEIIVLLEDNEIKKEVYLFRSTN